MRLTSASRISKYCPAKSTISCKPAGKGNPLSAIPKLWGGKVSRKLFIISRQIRERSNRKLASVDRSPAVGLTIETLMVILLRSKGAGSSRAAGGRRAFGPAWEAPPSISSQAARARTKIMSMSLSARNVAHRFGGVRALDGVSIDVPAGGARALVGESGSGKTTLLRCFNRMVVPDGGAVEVDGTDVATRPAVELRRKLGYVPQHGGLLPHWSVLRNVGLVPTLLALADPKVAAEAALDLVGLAPREFGPRFPHELSGGQRQRVALARALAARPGVILLDEPFGALDAITRADFQEAFEAVRRELGVTVLLVTHDLGEAARLADEITVMRAGRVEQSGPMQALSAAPATDYVATLLARALSASARLVPA